MASRAIQGSVGANPDPDISSDGEYGSDEDMNIVQPEREVTEKDSEELELERLIFGDSAGFQEQLRDFDNLRPVANDAGVLAEDKVVEEQGLDLLDDSALFFVDSGPSTDASKALVPLPAANDSDIEPGRGREQAAWEDSDDERLVVSLASVNRLRKLRKTEYEDIVSGKEYARRLRVQYERLYPKPAWAKPRDAVKKKRRHSFGGDASGSEASDSAEEMDVDDTNISVLPLARLLQSADALTKGRGDGQHKKRKLRAETLDIQRIKDVPGVQPSSITSLTFHPTLPLLLSSGPSSTLYLHHIQPLPPNPNPLLTSLHIKGTPLTTTAFHPNPADPRIFLSARRRYFHIWNLEEGRIEKVTRIYGHQHEQRSMERFSLSPDGKYLALVGTSRKGSGVINLLDASSLQWVAQARVESRGGIADFAWWSNSRGLTIAGKSGEVTEWSLKGQCTIARWQDEGAVGTTVLALGGKSGRDDWIGGDRWVAVGSSSGIVNVYDRREWCGSANAHVENGGLAPAPKPTRVLEQLTTAISHLRYSPDGQILAMASKWKKDALRLVHFPSCTVYKNWPTSGTPLGRITAVAWARGDGEQSELLFSVANEAGKIRLWEIRA